MLGARWLPGLDTEAQKRTRQPYHATQLPPPAWPRQRMAVASLRGRLAPGQLAPVLLSEPPRVQLRM